MIPAYDSSYLVHAKRILGWMLDAAVNLFGQSAERFWQKFLESGYADRFGSGEPRLLCGMTGYELAKEILTASNQAFADIPPTAVTDLSPEYWAGWALAQYQWRTSLTFIEIDAFAPISSVIASYHPYHEMDITHFFDFMDARYRAANPVSRLKRRRILCGLSQSDLSRISGIPVRMIQHYEQRAKNLGSAAFETVYKLSQALHCPPLLITEPVN